MLLAIINTTRRNNDEPEVDELPKDCAIKDVYREFAASPDAAEAEAYAHLGLDFRGNLR